MKPFLQLLIFFFILFASACKRTYSLGEDELLYDGASIEVGIPTNEQPKKNLKADLLADIRQQPNSSFFGKKINLLIYQKYKEKTKGIGKWLNKKIGEAPVVYNHNMTEQSRQLIQRALKNNGFLGAKVQVDTTVNNQLITVIYKVDGYGDYSIQEYITPPDTTDLLQLFNKNQKGSFIQKGKPYTLAAIDAERLRLENLARNNGYYEFDESAIYFHVDTSITAARAMDIYMNIYAPQNQKNYRPYTLGNITVYPDYSLNSDATTNETKDTIQSGHWKLIQDKKIIRLNPLREAIAQDSGAVFSAQLENQAVNYLLDLGIFKFVNLKYNRDTIDGQPVLNRTFFLTPNQNQDIGITLEASTQRTNFLGSSVGVNYVHRNLLRGAEEFQVSLSTGVETQAGDNGPFVNTLDFTFNTSLNVPRLLLPFKITKRLTNAIPSTIISFSASYEQRNELFTSASVVSELAYSWKKNKRFQHQLSPVQLTLLRLIDTSEEFEAELQLNPRLQASFNDIVILAAKYRFTYTNQVLNKRKNFVYCRGELETSGNLAALLASGQDDEQTLFNTPIAQYFRTLVETRYTMYQPKTSFVFRFSGGFVLPYGLSDAVPYIRQYFVGGASSLRAFRFRGVGPGIYSPATVSNQNENITFFDRVGDIKLESNIEFRFPIFSYLKGALFVDTGNVWLTDKSAEDLPEGAFNKDTFYKQLALGTGIGLRLDIDYVVLRMDIGVPLHNPSIVENNGWIISSFNGLNGGWIGDNVKYNLAIGYPF